MADTNNQPRSIADDEGAAECLDIANQLRHAFVDRDKLYRRIINTVFLLNEIRIPEGYEKTALQVHSPYPTHIVNQIAAALSINPFKVHFEPVGFGDSYRENATLRSHFFEASWDRQEREKRTRTFRRWMYSLVSKGEGVLKTVERSKTAWAGYDSYSKKLMAALNDPSNEDYSGLDSDSKDRVYNSLTEEFKRKTAYPITTIDVPPESFYYMKGEDGFTFACEVKEVPYFSALEKYGGALDKDGRVVAPSVGMAKPQWREVMGAAGSNNLVLVECWRADPAKVYYILLGPGDFDRSAQGGINALGNRGWVKSIKHYYTDRELHCLRGPYFHALGITTDSRDLDKQGLSILFEFLDLFPYLDHLLTIQGNSAEMTGFAAFKKASKADADADLPEAPFGREPFEEKQRDEDRIEPGYVYPADIEPVNMPSGGADLDKALAVVNRYLEMAMPSILQGVVGNDTSGYAANQAEFQASLLYDPIVSNAELALAERVGFESWLIENRIQERVYVWGQDGNQKTRSKKGGSGKGWLAIGPEDLQGVHRYTCTLSPKSPSTAIIKARTHQLLLANGMRLESWDQAVQDMGNNPDEVEKANLLYDLKHDPAIQQKLRQRVFQALATIDQKALATVPNTGTPESPTGMPAATGPAGLPGVNQPGTGGMPLQAQPAVGAAINTGGATPGAPATPAMPPQTAVQ
ncbi:MAG: hypothetical protein KGJ86_00020 [Chloroflexota bacterium]|nr:hypothetical protein [Chloroflexota bacterium]